VGLEQSPGDLERNAELGAELLGVLACVDPGRDKGHLVRPPVFGPTMRITSEAL
jgi:hypothetical protein